MLENIEHSKYIFLTGLLQIWRIYILWQQALLPKKDIGHLMPVCNAVRRRLCTRHTHLSTSLIWWNTKQIFKKYNNNKSWKKGALNKSHTSSNILINLLFLTNYIAQTISLMRKWLMRGLISCMSAPKEILITLPPPLGGKLPDKIFIASHPYSSLPT